MSQMRKFLVTGITVFFTVCIIYTLEVYVLQQFQSFDKSGIYNSWQNREDFKYSFSARYSSHIFSGIYLLVIMSFFYGLKKYLATSFLEQITIIVACFPFAILGLIGGPSMSILYSWIVPGVPVLEGARAIVGSEGWEGLGILILAVLSIPVAVTGLKLNSKIIKYGSLTTISTGSSEDEYYRILGILIAIVVLIIFIISRIMWS